jgi:DNA-binding NarL/FixJ family response regulator
MPKKAPQATPVTVAVVEDDPRIRRSLVATLELTEGVRFLGEFDSGEAALSGLPDLKPQVVIMDVNLPGMDGVECVRALATLLPETQILMLTVRQDTEAIFNALAAGASGYLLKPTRAAELRAAVLDVSAGGAPMSGYIARKVVQSFKQAPTGSAAPVQESLSARETEVLDLLSKGFAYKEIADQLGIAYGTVHVHVARIYKKLQVNSRGMAVAKYLGEQRGGMR